MHILNEIINVCPFNIPVTLFYFTNDKINPEKQEDQSWLPIGLYCHKNLKKHHEISCLYYHLYFQRTSSPIGSYKI